MSDRLAELRQQRALVHEHLAWLDREIAAASGQTANPPGAPAPIAASVSSVAPTLVPAAPATAALAAPAEPQAVAALAEQILDEYRVPPAALKSDVKKGCFLYLFAAFALLALGILGFYFAHHHG